MKIRIRPMYAFSEKWKFWNKISLGMILHRQILIGIHLAMLFGIDVKNIFSCVRKLVGQILFCILRKPVGLDVFPKEH